MGKIILHLFKERWKKYGLMIELQLEAKVLKKAIFYNDRQKP